MHSLFLFGRFQFYTTELLAQKNACRFISKHGGYYLKEHIQQFSELVQRENFQGAINLWNDIVRMCLWGQSLYMVQIAKVEIDKDFI